MPRPPIERIIDANINRAKEGTRVCEEIARFVLNSAALTQSFKEARHRVDAIVKKLPGAGRFIGTRDSSTDVGRPSDSLEARRQGIEAVFYANIQRVKEALRVLEEFGKLISPEASRAFKRLRYDIYELEKKTASRIHKNI